MKHHNAINQQKPSHSNGKILPDQKINFFHRN